MSGNSTYPQPVTWEEHERLIGVVRSVLSGLLVTHGTQLSDNGLRNLMYEVAAIGSRIFHLHGD